jgi:hypothetical protein
MVHQPVLRLGIEQAFVSHLRRLRRSEAGRERRATESGERTQRRD